MKKSPSELAHRRLARSAATVHTLEEARAFIDRAGLVPFSPFPECELPSFAEALATEVQNELWGWKDALPGTRAMYYGHLFRPSGWAARPGFVSLPLLADLYSLAPITQFGGDRTMLPRWAHLSREAETITDALDDSGALPIRELRKMTHLDGKANATRFENALIEAQQHFLIVKIGVTSTTRGNYGYVWEMFERVFPAVIDQANAIQPLDAARRITCAYAANALKINPQRIAAALGLEEKLIVKAGQKLVEEGLLLEENGTLVQPGC